MSDDCQQDEGSRDAEAHVLVERQTLGSTGALGTLRLHRPEALNAITPRMLEQLRHGLAELVADDEIAVIRLTGSGRAFSAGVDLKALGKVSLDGGSVGSALDGSARALIEELVHAPKIVIAQVNGFCFTGALELAMGCDLITAGKEAKFGDTHSKWGLRPTWGMSQRLPRFVGLARARELSYSARTFTGEQAAEWGLAIAAPALEDLDMLTLDLAQRVAQNSAGSLRAYKDLYRRALDSSLEEGLQYERDARYSIGDTNERLQGFLG